MFFLNLKMIRIIKNKKIKNPHSLNEDINYIKDNSIQFEKIGHGSEGITYLFEINKSLIINNEVLKPNKYVLKISHYDYPNHYPIDYKLDKLKLLSKYGLIPKIYIITKKYIIMKYIKGYTLDYLNKTLSREELLKLEPKINNLINIWIKLGFVHNDLNNHNIMVSPNLNNVYFIDPLII